MSEGAETAMFKHLFKSWRDKGQTQGLGTTHTVGKIGNISELRLHYDIFIGCIWISKSFVPSANVEQVKFNVMELHALPDLAAKQRMVDDASGDVKVKLLWIWFSLIYFADVCFCLRYGE